jgi:large subunit ribosomal protein L11
MEQLAKVAKMKRVQLLAADTKKAAKEILGTCVSMGVTVAGKDPREVQKEIDEGKHDSILQNET